MKSSLLLGVGVVLSLGVAGCGGSTVSATSDPASGCAAFATAFAQATGRCNGIPETEAASLLAFPCASLVAAVNAGKIRYDGGQAATCASDMQGLDCPNGMLPASCYAAFAGTVAPGGACNDDMECAQSGSCSGSSSCPRTCVAGVGTGGDCSTAQCQKGLVCAVGLPGASEFSCTAPRTLNQSCQASEECANGFYCDSTLQCLAQKTSGPCADSSYCASAYACLGPTGSATCQPVKGLNASCAVGQNECGRGLYCSTGTCVEWSTVNGPCGDLSGEYTDCVVSWCDATGTCQAHVAANGGCDSSQYDGQCAAGLTCSSSSGPGTCVATSCY